LAILPDDRQLYGVEQLFNNRRFGNLELAVSAKYSSRLEKLDMGNPLVLNISISASFQSVRRQFAIHIAIAANLSMTPIF
jgi:hypothetical protein